MYYKEKWMGYELYYTLSPNGNWIPFTMEMYAQKVRELQDQLKSVDLADVGEPCEGGCKYDDVNPLGDKFKCQKCGTMHDF